MYCGVICSDCGYTLIQVYYTHNYCNISYFVESKLDIVMTKIDFVSSTTIFPQINGDRPHSRSHNSLH